MVMMMMHSLSRNRYVEETAKTRNGFLKKSKIILAQLLENDAHGYVSVSTFSLTLSAFLFFRRKEKKKRYRVLDIFIYYYDDDQPFSSVSLSLWPITPTRYGASIIPPWILSDAEHKRKRQGGTEKAMCQHTALHPDLSLFPANVGTADPFNFL